MNSNYLKIGARALSMALHPLILPLYLVAMLFTQTAFSLFPTAMKWYLGSSVVLFGTVIPMVAVLILYKVGWLKDLHIHTRKGGVFLFLRRSIGIRFISISKGKWKS